MTFRVTNNDGREYDVEAPEDTRPGDIVGHEGEREFVLSRSRRSLYTAPGGDSW
jgi:hypothetical protein